MKNKPYTCPNCGEPWDGIECDNCGFDICSFDPYYDLD